MYIFSTAAFPHVFVTHEMCGYWLCSSCMSVYVHEQPHAQCTTIKERREQRRKNEEPHATHMTLSHAGQECQFVFEVYCLGATRA